MTKRSHEAPWEFVAIGTGAAEISVDELIYPRKKASSSKQELVVADDTPRNIGLDSYLTQFWRPTPTSLRLYGKHLAPSSSLSPNLPTQFDATLCVKHQSLNPIWFSSFPLMMFFFSFEWNWSSF